MELKGEKGEEDPQGEHGHKEGDDARLFQCPDGLNNEAHGGGAEGGAEGGETKQNKTEEGFC